MTQQIRPMHCELLDAYNKLTTLPYFFAPIIFQSAFEMNDRKMVEIDKCETYTWFNEIEWEKNARMHILSFRMATELRKWRFCCECKQ